MKGRRPIWIFGALLVIALTAGQMQSTAQAGQQKLGEGQSTADWQTFTDDKYDFSLSYPQKWEVRHYPAPEESLPKHVIGEYFHFTGGDGGFHLDTFGYSEVEAFFGWYKENNYPLPYANAPEKPNATISGLPAYVLVSPETRNSPTMLAAFWAYKGKVFRLEGTLATETFVRVLKSFRFENNSAETSVPEGDLTVASELQSYSYSNRCCDIDDPGNPYSCCFCCCCQSAGCDCSAGWPSCDSTGNGDCNGSCPNPPYNRGPQRGNCVWWASYLRQDTGGTPADRWGSPRNWVTMSLESNLLVSYRPTPGAIAVNNSHVALVKSVLNADRFRASEMNACWCNSSTGACGNSTCQQEVEKNVGGFRYIYPPLELTSNLTVPSYVDPSSGSVTVEARVRNRSGVAVGKGGSSLLWQLRVTDPYGVVHHWVAPACFVGFDPNEERTLRLTFLVPDYFDILCQINGAYHVDGLEYYESSSGRFPAPDEYIPVMNPDNHQDRACLNACCASGASAAQGAQLQGCPNYCGGQPGWTPTPIF